MDLVAHGAEQLALLRLAHRALTLRLVVFLWLGPESNVGELPLLARREIEREGVVVPHEKHVLRVAIEMGLPFLRDGIGESPEGTGAQIRDEDVAVPLDRAHAAVRCEITGGSQRTRAVHLRNRQ